ncbi:SLC13 family permease [Xanthovirga aplysinae]|uniref:SLC13 family permease n=1 Tax=Xanthovirga aplysinae TaxID=2529853 RepID=UPI0012BC587E|nr:SLC13 family permease [Xanthovirga aplysinae]MTI32257.1 SLC13 family permease [Xanthovirga aplysinae]
MPQEEANKWIVMLTMGIMITLLVKDKVRPSLVFIAAIVILIVSKVIPVTILVESLANKQILTIFLIIILSAVIQQNFNIQKVLDRFLAGSKNGRVFMLKMNIVVASMSSIFNNTPIVILFVPYVYSWAKRVGVEPSRLLMPLSFSAILGGMITIVGTSTNLVLNGLLEAQKESLLTFGDFFYLGLLVSFVGVIYLYFFGYNMLNGKATLEEEIKEHYREYFVEVKISPNSLYKGKSLKDSSLQKLKGICLIEVIRADKVFNVVENSSLELQRGDRLIFTGNMPEIIELLKGNQDLELAKNSKFDFADQMNIVEASLPSNSILEGVKIKDSDFRNKYRSVIIAVHRNGEQLSGRIGEITLRRGDLLLLASSDNASNYLLKKDFYLLSTKESFELKSKWSNNFFLTGLVLSIGFLLLGTIDLFSTLLILTALALFLNMVSLQKLKSEIDLDLLAILVASLAIGDAFISSGASGFLASNFLDFILPYGLIPVLIGLVLFTLLITSFITNVAAISVVFPLAYSISQTLGIEGKPLYLAVAFAASAAFLTPIGYQTNLIVAGPGGYGFRDFFKVGAPLTFLYLACSLLFIIFKYQLI